MSSKERKFVPRFRRKNAHLIDADEEEAQAEIEKDLQSHFTWKTNVGEISREQFDHVDHEQHQQILSTNDQHEQIFSYDLENSTEQFWKIHQGDENSIQWKNQTDENQGKQIVFSIDEKIDEQQWTIDEQKSIQLNLHDTNDRFNQQQFDTSHQQHHEQLFIQGDSFQDQMKFGIDLSKDESNLCLNNEEDNQTMSIDCHQIPSKDLQISLPEKEMLIRWLEGISQYELSVPSEQIHRMFAPLNEKDIQIDCNDLRSIKWSIDLLKDNLIRSYLLSLPNHFHTEQYSIDEPFHLNISIDEQTNEEYSISIQTKFEQRLSLSTNDIKEQILSLIDSIEKQQNFGMDDQQMKIIRWSLEELKSLVLNLSPDEIIQCLYSPIDGKAIQYENVFIESDEGNARALRRYRCKHFSIKSNEINQLDSQINCRLQFHGNESFAIGEQHIENDVQQQREFHDENFFIKGDESVQCYDILVNDSTPIVLGPCLYRSDYEREPPKHGPSSHREIGYVSYDASLKDPIYFLNKSFKRFVHLPKNYEKCSLNIFDGYEEFREKIRTNPDNYFRSFDSIDLRHLLHWYRQKQYLFSTTDPNLLRPPTFICRRTVLRTILANLYSDSEPWKLLVVRVKGQFYLALANKASKKAEDMTEDEYSGYHFEQLITSNQPNTTRMKDQIPLENPQHQFHTIQYWNFGKYNILYSNEIDGEISEDQLPKPDPNSSEESSKKCSFKPGYVEMKCTNKKIFYRDENKLHTLHWWAQMLLANIHTLIIGYKTNPTGSMEQIEFFSIEQIISQFFSSFNLYLKYCFSYLYSFLELIEKTIYIDDPNTIHQFSYIPQPLEIDPMTGKPYQTDLPRYVPFRYTQIKRSNQRHHNFLSQDYLDYIQRTIQDDQTTKTIDEEMKKRLSHRGRNSSILKKTNVK